MNDLKDRLQKALGNAYRLERELSGGGMSRVFEATEIELDRKVVVKVLPPEMGAGVPFERFEREIKLAAGLQHPHIVPVLTAGSAGELLYYVMPHVAGESVAERLELDRRLPVNDAARILRDVADALAYAHGRGIVHRDIKPANVLLSGSHGMVTDFGIAKAVGATTANEKLTGTGFALGTRAYMAPEQASADPATDHRADIYAFGVLAYEMLTGELPGTKGATAPVLPPAMADLVMRCLAEDPAARPQSAAELVTTLEAMTAPASGAVVKKRLSMAQITFIAVAVLIGVTAVIAFFRSDHEDPAVDPNLVVVLPFRVAGADSGLHYLREGMMDLLAAKLTGEGGPRAADPQSVMSMWRRSGGSDTEDVPQETAMRIAGALGAGEVLVGGVVGSAQQLTLTASIVSAPDGAIKATSNVVGPADSVPALVDRLAGQLLVRSAALDEALSTRSVAALRSYLAGRAAYRRGNYPTAVQHLGRALVHDSTLTQAALWLLCAEGWGAAVPNVERVRHLAWNGRDRLSAPERARLESLLGRNFPEPPTRAELLELAERAVELSRDNADTWYLFGDSYFHDGAYLGYEDHAERARGAFERALALDSTFVDPLGHLVDLAARRGDTAEVSHMGALYLATEGGRRGGYSVAVRWLIARSLGDTALAAEVMQAIDTVSSIQPGIVFVAMQFGEHEQVARIFAGLARRATTRGERALHAIQRVTVLMNQGRMREALALADSAGFAAPSDPASIRVQAAIHSAVIDSARTAASVRELARVVAGSPPKDVQGMVVQYSALALLGQWAILGGDAAGASRAAARFRAAPAGPIAVTQYTAIWAELLDGHAAALRGLANARAYADRADSLLRQGADLWPPYVENIILSRLYDAVGDVPQALAAVRRGAPRGWNLLQMWFSREEGRLAAKAGDRDAAVAAYQRYLTMLHNPDPEVAALADGVRREIGLLDRD